VAHRHPSCAGAATAGTPPPRRQRLSFGRAQKGLDELRLEIGDSDGLTLLPGSSASATDAACGVQQPHERNDRQSPATGQHRLICDQL